MDYREWGGLSRKDFDDVVEALKTWASTHPKKSEPIVMLMGKTFTPDQFLREVAEQTSFGLSFLDYIRRQSAVSDTRPRTFIDRAILANRIA
jgi:hypothetical protein